VRNKVKDIQWQFFPLLGMFSEGYLGEQEELYCTHTFLSMYTLTQTSVNCCYIPFSSLIIL